MGALLDSDLRTLRSARRWFVFGTGWFAAAIVVGVTVGQLAAAARVDDVVTALLAFAIAAAPAFHWVQRLLEMLEAACPRCRESFFQTARRGIALPSLAGRCGHCGLAMAPAAPKVPSGRARRIGGGGQTPPGPSRPASSR